jgi:hypothetical protein
VEEAEDDTEDEREWRLARSAVEVAVEEDE